MRFILLFILLVPLRTWTDSSGKYTTRAELVEAKDGVVYLKRDDRIKAVPISRLSESDQVYVRTLHPAVDAPKDNVDTQSSASAAKAPKQDGYGKKRVKHVILDMELLDTPIKTEVVFEALITEEVTETNVDQLLKELQSAANKVSCFKHHGGRPTHVFLYVYPSIEHYNSGFGQWVGMLSQVGKNDEPTTSINKEFIASLLIGPVEKFGPTEEKRKEVFRLIVLAERNADQQAESRYSLEPWRNLKKGETIRVTKTTPLMPEIEPADAIDALSRIRHLEAGTAVRITRVVEREIAPWYAVRVLDDSGDAIATGWINSVALIGQVPIDRDAQLTKQTEYAERLIKTQKADIAKQYGLTNEQLRSIAGEAFDKNWALPK